MRESDQFWTGRPVESLIESFSKPVTDIPFPAITLCNEQGLDTGEYVRNVFNNLAFTEDEGSKSVALKEGFKSVLDSFTYYNKSDGEATVEGKVVANFMFFWLRFVKRTCQTTSGAR